MATEIKSENFMDKVSENVANIVYAKCKIRLDAPVRRKITEEMFKATLEQLVCAVADAANEQGGEARMDIANLLTIEITNRESEEGEKDGNRMIALIPGPQVKMLSKGDQFTEGEED